MNKQRHRNSREVWLTLIAIALAAFFIGLIT